MPWVMALRVVSLPATASISTKKPNSSSDSPCPSISALISLVTMSSRGQPRRSSAMFMLVAEDLDRRPRAGVLLAGQLRVVVADHLVGPGEDLAPVLLRDADQVG